MAMTFTSLTGSKSTTGSIKAWTMKSTVESETVLEEAESWIYRRLRVRDMRQVDTSSTIASGADYISTPTGYLGTITLTITSPGRYRLHHMTVQNVEERRPYNSSGAIQAGLPTMFYEDGSSLYFNVKADRAYTLRHVYWKQPTALSSSNTTNFLTSRYPRLLRCACMGFASEFLKDYNAMDGWLVKAQAEIDEINAEQDMNMGSFEPYAMVE